MNALTRWLMKEPRTTRSGTVAALDIGSSKIVCFIARAEPNNPPRVIGIGHQLAEGMRHGSIANMESLQRSISAAVATAEQMAGETIDRVTLNVPGSQLVSHTVNIELPLNNREVTDADIHRVIGQAHSMVPEDQYGQTLELIHALPTHYTLDQQKGIHTPIGMVGKDLHAQFHLIAGTFGPVRTLVTAVARCHLEVEKLVAAPYASGLACLVEDEMDLGSLIIDMGAGTTSFAVFFDGQVVYTDGIAVGGSHVTNDIARGLTTSVVHAERLKTLYANAVSSTMDDREIIDVPQIGEEEPEHANHVPRSQLVKIVQPRIEEIFELLRDRMVRSGFKDIAGRRVVLTGGASQMPGVREMAQRLLDKQVRLGRPLRVTRPFPANSKSNGQSFTGLAEATSGPAFSTTAGLLAVAMQPELATPYSFAETGIQGGFLSRAGQWLKQNM